MAAEGSYQVPPENDQTHSFSPRHSQLSSEGQTSSLRNWHHYWHAAVVVLGTGASIYLFHQGQVGVEWGINLTLNKGTDEATTKLVKPFTLFGSIDALKNEGRTSLVILLWVTSVVWPYAKVTINLAIFFLSYKWVGMIKALDWIEALGKWNHVDVIVCYVMILAIHLTVTEQEVIDGLNNLEDGIPTWLEALLHKAEIELFDGLKKLPIGAGVTAHSGLFIYVAAVCLSMVTGHFTEWAIWSRQNRQDHGAKELMIGKTPRVQRKEELFPKGEMLTMRDSATNDPARSRRGVGGLSLSQILSTAGKLIGGFLIILNIAVLVVALNTTFINVTYKIPILTPASKHYTIITGLLKVLQDASNLDSASQAGGLRFIACILTVFAVVSPAIRVLTQFVIWFARVSPRSMQMLVKVSEISICWSGLDVLLLAVGIAALNIGPLTVGLAGDINETFGHLCHDCFEVSVVIADGFWVILAHCVLSVFMNWMVPHVYYIKYNLDADATDVDEGSRRPTRTPSELFGFSASHDELRESLMATSVATDDCGL